MKGLIPVLVARYAMEPAGPIGSGAVPAGFPHAHAWAAAVALAAMVGHCFSVYLRFTGGRGVSTSLGVMIGLDWRAGLIAFGCWIAVVALSRYISLASMIACNVAAPLLFAFGAPRSFVVAVVLIGLLVIIRHIPNIQRLLNGTERKIGQKERVAADADDAP